MARKALIIKAARPPRYGVQQHNRCRQCGRPRGYIRKFGLCRICFRSLALKGQVPGVRKSSW